MKKKNFIAVICLVVVGIVGFFGASRFIVTTDADRPDFNIALFAPAVHPAMDEIMQGFKKTIAKQSSQKYHFTDYNANGNPTLLRAQAEEIIHQHYDLIFTIGVTTTHTVVELLRKKDETTPVVFTAIDDPVGLAIVDSVESSGNNVTGVMSTPLYEQQIEQLLALKPTVKNILLVYDPAHGKGLEEQKTIFTDLLKKKNITLQPVEVMNPNEISQKVTPYLSSADVVLVLTDHTVVMGIPSLAILCARYGVTLYASDLNSADKGAAIAFGVMESDYGRLAAPLALNILENKKNPAQLALVFINEQYIKLNTAVMKEQGLVVDDAAFAALQARGGIVI